MILEYKKSNIHYTTTGKGPAIVLLHGFLENLTMWAGLEAQLSKNYQVICIDLLGHGKTDCIGSVHTMDAMAEAVLAVINQLKINKAVFIGHSMGGYVALALAEKAPTIFEGLCLMNSTFEADDKARKVLRTRAIKMVQHNFENMVRLSFANLFAAESKITYETAYNNALNQALKTSVQGYIAAQEGMRLRSDYFEIFKTLPCNKLIIIGKKDTVINGNQIIAKIKNTTIKFIELSAGHMSHIENKTELLAILLEFTAHH